MLRVGTTDGIYGGATDLESVRYSIFMFNMYSQMINIPSLYKSMINMLQIIWNMSTVRLACNIIWNRIDINRQL